MKMARNGHLKAKKCFYNNLNHNQENKNETLITAF